MNPHPTRDDAKRFMRELNALVAKTGCMIAADAPLYIVSHSTGRFLLDIEMRGTYRVVEKVQNPAAE